MLSHTHRGLYQIQTQTQKHSALIENASLLELNEQMVVLLQGDGAEECEWLALWLDV